MTPNQAPWDALSDTLAEERAREILQSGPQAHLLLPVKHPVGPQPKPIQPRARLEWWVTSKGTVPAEITRQADGMHDVRAWEGITLWM